jgi:hypothetical protein
MSSTPAQNLFGQFWGDTMRSNVCRVVVVPEKLHSVTHIKRITFFCAVKWRLVARLLGYPPYRAPPE